MLRVRVWSPGCGHRGKWKYLSEKGAYLALEQEQGRRRRDRGKVNKKKTGVQEVYYCTGCEGYHLTSGKNPRAKAGRKKRAS